MTSIVQSIREAAMSGLASKLELSIAGAFLRPVESRSYVDWERDQTFMLIVAEALDNGPTEEERKAVRSAASTIRFFCNCSDCRDDAATLRKLAEER